MCCEYYVEFLNTSIVNVLLQRAKKQNDTREKIVRKSSINEAINALSFPQHNEVHPTGDPRKDLITVMKGHHV
ncbi:MAG: hypothetical protein RLZ72_602 [Actinomycetota bacterium]